MSTDTHNPTPTEAKPRGPNWVMLAVVFMVSFALGAGIAAIVSERASRQQEAQLIEREQRLDQRQEALDEAEAALGDDGAGQDQPDPEPGKPEQAREVGGKDSPLAPGDKATLADYELTITEVNFQADELVMEAHEWNEPSEAGRYVLVMVEGTFVGDDPEHPEGNPYMDLTLVMTVDSRQYIGDDTLAIGPEPMLTDVPTLEPGGTFEGYVVFSVPEKGLDSATLFVESTFTWTQERLYFDIQRG